MTRATDKVLNKRWAKARRVAAVVSRVPFVRYIGVNGSLARGASHKDSDIDFFIVVETGHLWLIRPIVTGVVQVLGVRRHSTKIAGRICLNRFFTTALLEIKPHSAGNAREFTAQVPLYDDAQIHERFAKDNQWVQAFGCRFSFDHPIKTTRFLVKSAIEQALKGRFGAWLEEKLARPQRERIARDPRTHAPAGRVVFTDYELTFNPPK